MYSFSKVMYTDARGRPSNPSSGESSQHLCTSSPRGDKLVVVFDGDRLPDIILSDAERFRRSVRWADRGYPNRLCALPGNL